MMAPLRFQGASADGLANGWSVENDTVKPRITGPLSLETPTAAACRSEPCARPVAAYPSSW